MISRVQDLSHWFRPETVQARNLTAPEKTFSEALTEESSTSTSQVSASSSGGGQYFGGWTTKAGTPAAPQAAALEAPTNASSSAPFVPQFMDNVVESSAMGGGPWPLNPAYFATQETAQYIADKFGTGKIVQVPFGGTGGPYASSAQEYHIVLQNGATVNAGLLADYYVRMPESQYPGVADTMIQMAVTRAEQFNS